jgi:hypothetical protein
VVDWHRFLSVSYQWYTPIHSSVPDAVQFLGVFAWNNLVPIGRILMKFYILAFLGNVPRKFKFDYSPTRITGTVWARYEGTRGGEVGLPSVLTSALEGLNIQFYVRRFCLWMKSICFPWVGKLDGLQPPCGFWTSENIFAPPRTRTAFYLPSRTYPHHSMNRAVPASREFAQ